VRVIELNPWSEASSASLFSWENENDRNIIFGKAPFQFRILERPFKNPLDNLGGSLMVMLLTLRPPKEENEKKVQQFVVSHFGKKLGFKRLFKEETSLFCVQGESHVDFEKIFHELAVFDKGMIHWVFTDALCHSLGTKKIFPPGCTNYFMPTMYVVCLYEIYRKSFPKYQKQEWDGLIMRAYAYLFDVHQGTIKDIIYEAHNCCLGLKNLLQIIGKKS